MRYTDKEQETIRRAAAIAYADNSCAINDLMQALDDFARASVLMPSGDKTDALLIWGGDSCFDLDFDTEIQFYQYTVTTAGNVYKLYYRTSDDNGDTIDIDCIDYDKPAGAVYLGNVNG